MRLLSIFLVLAFVTMPTLAGRITTNSPLPPSAHPQAPVCGSPGYVCSRIVPGRTATASILNNLCKDANGVPYHEPFDEQITWINPINQPPQVTLSHRPDQLMINEAETQYAATTSELPIGKYKINYTSINSEHCNGWYFDWAIDVIPEITSDTNVIWWFGKGNEPAGWAVSTILKATKGADSYTWKIDEGAERAKFSNGQSTITTTSPRTKLLSKGRSKAEWDVKVSVMANEVTSNPYAITIKAPHSIAQKKANDEVSLDFGYSSYIHYKMIDQFNYDLPDGILPATEDFWTPVEYQYPDCNWTRGEPGGDNAYNDDMVDAIDGSRSGPYIPTALAPQHPLGSREVYRFKGAFFIGAFAPGEGLIVQTHTWQKYVDHGRHLNKVSPAP